MAPEGRGERLPFALRYGSLEPLFWSVSRLCERFVSGRLGLVFQHFLVGIRFQMSAARAGGCLGRLRNSGSFAAGVIHETKNGRGEQKQMFGEPCRIIGGDNLSAASAAVYIPRLFPQKRFFNAAIQ